MKSRSTPLLPIPIQNAILYGKAEWYNPSGSIKDRAARSILHQAHLSPGDAIVEATSGNTGIALASLAARMGLRCHIVMPENMSKERMQLMRAYGATVHLSPAQEGMAGAARIATQLASSDNCVYVNQFTNPANPSAHETTTGPEIWHQTGGKIDLLIAGVGSGGTITGTGRYLKARNPNIRIVAVLPAPGEAIAGLGSGLESKILDPSVIDQWVYVSYQNAADTLRQLARRSGLLVGPSSGAAIFAAQTMIAEENCCGKTMVAILPDSGERYLSTGLF